MAKAQNSKTAEEAYVYAHVKAQHLVTEIMGLLQDVPAPSETFQPHWGHVGDMVEVARRLEAVAAFLNHTEV